MQNPYIMVAPNGARRTKKDHPALPMTIGEITHTAKECFDAGADALHLHIRDEDGAHSLDSGLYKEALQEMALLLPDMDVQITTESAGIFDVEAQLHCLKSVRPSWASISIREIARNPSLAPQIYQTCLDNEITIQHILYDREDIALLIGWQEKKLIADSQGDVIFVLGRYSENQQSQIADLAPFLEAMPEEKRHDINWMVCAFGAQEHACLAAVATLGGQLRVGFENSLNASDGCVHADNAASLKALISSLTQA